MIKANKDLKLNNLLSLRKKIKQNEVEKEMRKIGVYLQKNNFKKSGPLLTSTFSVENIEGEHFLDMEILVPIDKEVELSGDYKFKKIFQLVNAVYARHEGSPNLLQETYNEIMRYIQNNNLQQITSAYNVNVKDLSLVDEIDDMIIDVYIGVSPNIL